MQLNYLTQVEANTETTVLDGEKNVASFAPDEPYQSIAFSGLEKTKSYTVTKGEEVQQGVDKDGVTAFEFTITDEFNNFIYVIDLNLTLKLNESSLYFRVENGLKQFSKNDELWITYLGTMTIEQDNVATSTQNTVTVISGEHDITLNGVNVDVSENDGTGAFDIQGASNVTLTLALNSENTLNSGDNFAGLQVQTKDNVTASVTILGEGMLTANGGYYGAGIGDGLNGDAGTVTISESVQVIATGGTSGAGIGGVLGITTINGNAQVTANGGLHGAGISCEGYDSKVGIIRISGNSKVTANGGTHGAGIGSGLYSRAGTVIISENAEVTAVGGGRNNIGFLYPSAIGIGSYRSSYTKPEGVTLSIGSNATVIAVARGVEILQAIDTLGEITAPENEEVANILQLNYLEQLEANTETAVFNSVSKTASFTPDKEYQSIAFSNLEKTKSYTVMKGQEVQQGVNADGITTLEFTVNDKLNNFTSVTDSTSVLSPTLKINESSLYFRVENGNKQYSKTNEIWINYSGTVTIEQDDITTSTQNKIAVLSGEHDIALNGVNIDLSYMPNIGAFHIYENASANLILAQNSENVLKSGVGFAGIQVQKNDTLTASVTIQGSGALTAIGGNSAAGIGGGYLRQGGTIIISGNPTVTAIGGSRFDEYEICPSAIGSGAYSTTGTKLDGATISIGTKTTVIAVAQHDVQAIDALGGITAPENETVANILQLNYLEQVEANTETSVFDDTSKVVSFTPDVEYQSIAFSGLETNKEYSIVANNTVQQGQKDDGLTNIFIISSELTTYTNVQATEEILKLVTFVNTDGDVLAKEYVVTGGTAPRPVLPQLRTEEYVPDFEDSEFENITTDKTLVYNKVPKMVEVTASLEYLDKLDITVDNAPVNTEVVYGKIVKATYTGEDSVIGWKINSHLVSVTNSKVYAFYIVEDSIIEPILEGTAIEGVDINVGVLSYSTEDNNTTKAYYPIVAAGYQDATEVKYGVIRSTVESDVTEENIRQYLADTTQQTNSNIVREYTETNVMNGDGRYNYVAVMPTDTDKTLYVKAWIEVDGVLYVSNLPIQ